MENNQDDTHLQLEFSAKILSWEWGKNITPRQVFVGFHLWKLTKEPFKECVEAAYEAEKVIEEQINIHNKRPLPPGKGLQIN